MDNARLQEYQPVPLSVGHIIWTEKIQLVLAYNTDIYVTAGAQIIVYASCNGISHKLFGFLFLEKLEKLSLHKCWHFTEVFVHVTVEAVSSQNNK